MLERVGLREDGGGGVGEEEKGRGDEVSLHNFLCFSNVTHL